MPARKHSRQNVIDAALQLLNDDGLDAVSIREVARRMRVNVNTVSFHVGTKARMLGLMSDAVLSQMSLEDLPADGFDRVEEILRRYRDTLLAYRDGARLTAGNVPLEEHALRFVEALTSALARAGVPDGENVLGTWALFYFLLGVTQEQQAAQGASPDTEVALSSDDYPALHRLGPGFTSVSFDERFEFGLQAILGSLRTAIHGEPAHTHDTTAG
ncbi:TetR/AcrR family transcriptional regulator C-terminal domain-containing protein [Okibacterium endophyticum]